MQKTAPVKVGDEVIGKVTVKDTGAMTLSLQPSHLGSFMWEKLSEGKLDHMDLAPGMIIHIKDA